MVLIEIGEAIIEIDRRADVIGDGELKGTDRGVSNGDTVGRGCCILGQPPQWSGCLVG